MGYRFQKWFFDFLSAKEDYLLCYISGCRLLGKGIFNCSYRFRSHDGESFSGDFALPLPASASRGWEMDCSRDGITARVERQAIVLEIRRESARFHLHFPGADLALAEPALTIHAAGSRSLSWRPLALASRPGGECEFAGKRFFLPEGSAYADYVSSEILPYAVPARHVLWGRAACRRLAFTYTFIQGEKTSWGAIVIRDGNSLTRLEGAVSLNHQGLFGLKDPLADTASSLLWTSASPEARARIEIRPRGLVAVDRFISPAVIGSRLATRALRWVARDPRGVKRVAQMTIQLERGAERIEETASGIHEHAVFR